jgi:hypothetical protein
LILADEPAQLLVAADLVGAGIVDHHLARPHVLQGVDVTVVQCRDVLLSSGHQRQNYLAAHRLTRVDGNLAALQRAWPEARKRSCAPCRVMM